MVVVDVSDPTNPRDIIAVTPSGEPNEGIHTLFTEIVDGKTMAYLADGYSNAVFRLLHPQGQNTPTI